MAFFGIGPHIDLDVMRLNLPIERLASHSVGVISDSLAVERPDLVIAQGDTTTVAATALACFLRRRAAGACGGRTANAQSSAPFPEEANRVVASHSVRFTSLPRRRARRNLEHERIARGRIFVTGNTVVDALFETSRRDVPIGVELDRAGRHGSGDGAPP